MYRAIGSRPDFPVMEEAILKFWREENVFEKSVAARQKGSRFVFYEGPPTANGRPGIHHVLARVFKDAVTRYHTMKGEYAPRVAGWDTHGLPVELEVEKQLGLHNKAEIESYGIAKFNALCRESVFRYLKEWDAMTERIGYWVDLKHPYVTMDNGYIESIWWALAQLWSRDLIYHGYRVTPHCPRCGTSLSSHEVALGYKDDTVDPSVYIKFRVLSERLPQAEGGGGLRRLAQDAAKPLYLMAWTTTPWTLPGNTAVAVSPGADYVAVETDDSYLVLAEARKGVVGLGDNPVVARLKGRALMGVAYEPLFNPHEYGVERKRFTSVEAEGKKRVELKVQVADTELAYQAIGADFVSMEEGTGIVHIAPAYGELDYEAGSSNGLDFVHPVDLAGKMTGNYPFAGKFVKSADPLVLENLAVRGLIFKSEKITHTYPFCWRCGTPLLYFAKPSWYIRTTAFKEKMMQGNQAINWYPDYIREGRFGDWLKNNVDWAFSRERYWGTPLPIWRCECCHGYECVGGVDELKAKPGLAGIQEPLDLHRPYVDEITYNCPTCGGLMRRQSEVIDCWFDSGAMPFAQHHYPFENQTMTRDGRFPADFICEAVDQTRGWFYSLHALGIMLFDSVAYHNVICLGHIMDAKGEKMSKTRGNVVEPGKVINKFGADPVRWYCLTAAPPGNVRRFSEEMVADVTRSFFLTLWNVYSFFVTYADIDRYQPAAELKLDSTAELDRWMLSELNQLVADVDQALAGYDPTTAGRKIEEFVNDLSNWYVRRSRRRFWKSESDSDKLAAYNTLYHCLVTLARLLAPLTPFLAEELYQNLVRSVVPDAPPSVHLTDFPRADEGRIEPQLTADTKLVMKIASLGRAARSQAGIKVRQPVDSVLVKLAQNSEQKGLERFMMPLLEELNVKHVAFISDASPYAAQAGYAVVNEGSYSAAVSREVSPELLKEGMAREVVHRLQTMRRSAGFEIADYIVTYYDGDAYLDEVMAQWGDYVKQETLSRALVKGVPREGIYQESLRLVGHELCLGVLKSG
jgi:isoleucyl-tRNA synthetase